MKKVILFYICLSMLANFMYAQTTYPLSDAIQKAVSQIEARLDRDTPVAVYSFEPRNGRYSSLVHDEVQNALINSGKTKVLDRENIELINQEVGFQESGEVSMRSAVIYGQKIGAQSIVYGKIEEMKSYWRISILTVQVETGIVQASTIENVKDPRLPPTPAEGLSPWAYGFMNLAFGLGSYFQGDIPGGAIITAGYVLSAGLVAFEFLGTTAEDPWAGIPGYVGFGLAGVTTIFGLVKPHVYERNNKIASVMDRVRIVAVSNEQGIKSFGISYKYSF